MRAYLIGERLQNYGGGMPQRGCTWKGGERRVEGWDCC